MVDMNPETRKYSLIAGIAFLAFGLGMYAVTANRHSVAQFPPPSIEIRPATQQTIPARFSSAGNESAAASRNVQSEPTPSSVAGESFTEPAPSAISQQSPEAVVQASPLPAEQAPTPAPVELYVPPAIPASVPAASTYVGNGSSRSPSSGYIPPPIPAGNYGRYEPRQPVARTPSLCCTPPPPPRRSRMPPPPAPKRSR
jgi:fused signal recognition particle receptor